MATIVTYLICPTIGALWQAATQKWETLVSDTTLTLSAGSETTLTLLGMKLWYIQAVGAVDTNKYVYAAMDVRLESVKIPASYVTAAPGWRYVPRIQPQLYGARVTNTNFVSVMLELRKRIWIDVCGSNTPVYVQTLNNFSNTNFESYLHSAPILAGYQTITDGILCTVIKPAWTTPIQGNQPPSDGVGTSATFPAVPATDTAGIVQALQDIAHSETQASFNNGAYTVLITSGDTLTLP